MNELSSHSECVNDLAPLHVMSTNLPPFASILDGIFCGGIEYNLLQLISEKLKKNLHFEYLDSITHHKILQQIIHGNLSEAFQTLVNFKIDPKSTRLFLLLTKQIYQNLIHQIFFAKQKD